MLVSRGYGLLAAAVLAGVLESGCRLAVSPPRGRAQTGPDTTGILAELHDFYRDFSARDWTAFTGHFWPGADITTLSQPPGEDTSRVTVTPVPDFVAQTPQGPGSRPILEERMLDARITTAGDLALAWVRYRAQFGEPRAVSQWEGIDAFTLMRHAGRWRIVELAFQSRGPGP